MHASGMLSEAGENIVTEKDIDNFIAIPWCAGAYYLFAHKAELEKNNIIM